MGLESPCSVSWKGKTSKGKAHLEPGEIVFKGDFRLRISLQDVKKVEARGGELRVSHKDGTAVFALGRDAEKWALKIRYPRGLLDKLGIKPGASVCVIRVEDAPFWSDLKARTPHVSSGASTKACDVVVVGMRERGDLADLTELKGAIKPEGAIWVVWPKGRKEFREDDVRGYGPTAGLVDVKVVSFSDTHSGLKMVIPVALRPKSR
jgi:hypothetical protein